ncbi:hypothetical protein EJ07DRAFT_166220 [Lizonia empirigonia]|nr:hypothetical protein EJ07DRAFT_166220 [Lizonia empirigonia]
MGEADMDTPRSTSEAPLLKAAKDKNCPFCGQAFTSSSLGRHLDLYIRAKNPKAADGIHVVDEIRKLRGGITRRQAKGSISKKEERGGERRHSKHRVGSEGSSTLVQSPAHDPDDDELDVGKTRGAFNEVSWCSSSSSRQASRAQRKHELDQRQRHGDAHETGRAAELALRELLKSVREASDKATGGGLFDFDPYTLNFPALCLHMLPAPPTLFSPTPFPTAESWSLAPPAQKQLDALNRCVRERLLALQRQRQLHQLYPAQHDPAAALHAQTPPLPTPPLCDPDPQKLFSHIADAYNHWMLQPDATRHEYWQLEVLRCYARANAARRDAELQLEHARREIDCLKASRCAAADHSPVVIALGADTAKELGKQGMDFRNWDFDRLVDKWRAVVRENRAAASGMAAQKQLPDSRSGSLASLPPQPYAPATRPSQSSPVDAEGDDDDDDDALHLDTTTLADDAMQHHMQHHALPLQPTPIHPAQHHHQHHTHMQPAMHVTHAQAQASIHAHAHAHAQAQAWAAARQHMNPSRNQPYSPHHQQISPHAQHLASATPSRRPSAVLLDPHVLAAGMAGSLGMSQGLDALDQHADPYLRMDLVPMPGFVGSNGGG